jgi:hypothetical protein
MSRGRSLWGLGVSIALCLTAAALGARLRRPAIGEWYAHLNKPTWTPPNWLFWSGVVGPVRVHGGRSVACVAPSTH